MFIYHGISWPTFLLLFYFVFLKCHFIPCFSDSWFWGNHCAGGAGRHSVPAHPLSSWWPPPSLPVLLGEWPAAPWPSGPSTLVTAWQRSGLVWLCFNFRKYCWNHIAKIVLKSVYFSFGFPCAGKVFPKLRRKARALAGRQQAPDSEDEEATDYVFRIITSLKPDRICESQTLLIVILHHLKVWKHFHPDGKPLTC